MSELGELFESVHAGRHRFSTVRGLVREWRHFPRGRKAFSRVMSRRGTPPGEASLVADAPTETETRSKVWVAKPDRMRLEREVTAGVAITVVDGDRWWTWHPEHGFASGEEADRLASGTTVLLDQLLDPWPLLGAVELEVGNTAEVAGRSGILLRASAPAQSGRTRLLGVGQGADAYEFVVDDTYGIFLRTTALIDGEPFETKELVDVAFGVDLPEDAFTAPA